MGDFRKNILKTDLEGKILTRKYLAKKIPTLEKIYLMAYSAGKKSYTVVRQKKNSITRGFSLLHSAF